MQQVVVRDILNFVKQESVNWVFFLLFRLALYSKGIYTKGFQLAYACVCCHVHRNICTSW